MFAALCSPLEPARKRKGGWRQRLADEDEEPSFGLSKLGTGLLLEWCDGNLSARRLRKHCNNAVLDGITHPMLTRLSNIGHEGSLQRCHRGAMDLLEMCGLVGLLTELSGDVTHCLLPSTMVRVLETFYPYDFKKRLGADECKLRDFWTQLLARPRWADVAENHPVLQGKSIDDLSKMIPCTLHVDAGPVTKTKSANCMCWSSLLGQGSEKLTIFPICTHLKDTSTKTDEEIYLRVFADFDALAIACNWRFCLLFSKADEETHANEWGMTHYNGAHEMCTECLANRSDRPYTDLTADATWQGSENMPVAVCRARVRQPAHSIIASHYFHRWFIILEIMHVMDCKGVSAWLFGGIIGLLMVMASLGINRQQRLDTINMELDTWRQTHPGAITLPKLRMGNLINDGWWDLHGPAIKAAMTKSAAPFFCSLAEKYFIRGNPRHDYALALVRDLVAFDNILDSQTMFPSPTAVAQLKVVTQSFGSNYMWSRELAKQAGDLMFPVRPKVHKMMHFPAWAQVVNPRSIHAYAEESSVGTTTKVWKASMDGKYQKTVQMNVLTKRLAGFFLRLESG